MEFVEVFCTLCFMWLGDWPLSNAIALMYYYQNCEVITLVIK